MKIIRTDNFGRSGEVPGEDEAIVADHIPNKFVGQIMVDALNDKADAHGPDYFHLVEDSYVLKKFQP